MHQQGVSRALHSRGTFNLHFQLPVSYDVERLHLQVYPGLWSKPALTKTKTRAKLKGKISKCFFFLQGRCSVNISELQKRPGQCLSWFLLGYSFTGLESPAYCLFLSSGTPSVVVLSRLMGREPRFRQGAEWLLGVRSRVFSFISFEPSQYLDYLRWSRSSLCQWFQF